MFIDDQLRGVLTFLKPTARLTIILDCCHSGTGMDLAYNYQKTTIAKRVRVFGGRGRGRRRRRRTRYRWVKESAYKMVKDTNYNSTNGTVVMFSGCQDPQYSADAYEEGSYQGAMTYSFLKAVSNPNQTWEGLLLKIREILKQKGYKQLPNLASGKALNIKETFKIV